VVVDFYRAVQALRTELRKIDQAIATLEGLIAGTAARPASRRGRKSMPAEERKIVSERMKKYWARRRAQRANAQMNSG
jgi:hypothetical protein